MPLAMDVQRVVGQRQVELGVADVGHRRVRIDTVEHVLPREPSLDGLERHVKAKVGGGRHDIRIIHPVRLALSIAAKGDVGTQQAEAVLGASTDGDDVVAVGIIDVSVCLVLNEGVENQSAKQRVGGDSQLAEAAVRLHLIFVEVVRRVILVHMLVGCLDIEHAHLARGSQVSRQEVRLRRCVFVPSLLPRREFACHGPAAAQLELEVCTGNQLVALGVLGVRKIA